MRSINSKQFKDQMRAHYRHVSKCSDHHYLPQTFNGQGGYPPPTTPSQPSQSTNDYSTADQLLYVSGDGSSIVISPGNGSKDKGKATDVNSNVTSVQIKCGTGPAAIKITDSDIEFTIKPNSNTAEHTYNLGAIIEAIQEFNRRTGYIDSTMSFADAKNHFDVNKDSIDGAYYGGEDDELPAATNDHQTGQLVGNRSISACNVPRMKLVSYDPEFNDISKNISFARELSTLNAYALLDDPTVISPESVAIRMRGCPYLLQ